jgi:hypothetical protein
MKYVKMLGIAAMSAMAMMAVSAGTAAATTLEVNGSTTNHRVDISASLAAGASLPLTSTSGGTLFNTCTESTVGGHTTSPYTGTAVKGPITTLTFTGCKNNVTPHLYGTLTIEHIKGTTNGTLRSTGAEVTSYSTIFGTYLNCKTGEGTHLGTLAGAGTGKHASMHVNAALNCGITSALWSGTYTVTSPTGLGVSA